MMRYFRNRTKKAAGLSLVEILIAILISSIAMTGLLVAYTDGVRYVRDSSDMMVMRNEGAIALETISRYIRVCNRAFIKSYGGNRRAKLELRYPPEVTGRAEFFFVDSVHELRWNDSTEDRNKFNMVLLPMMDYRRRPGEDAYIKVRHVEFSALDFIGPINPTTEGYGLIKVELVLENPRGDTLYLSTVTAKRNRY
jgi:type II secretory pathway pseudopilin PulG